MKKAKKSPTDYIKPLTINGLSGRVLKLPARRQTAKREILLIYGSHASIERMLGVCENLAIYGSVTLPDLPGFGGMDSFYQINQKPTLDNLADYLATFIKLNFKKRSFTIGAMSFGFVIVTRMLQLYPELTNQIETIISFVGFSHWQDFKIKKRTFLLFRWGSSLCSNYPVSTFIKYIILRGPLISLTYHLLANYNPKMQDASRQELDQRIKFEIKLWQSNDIRTYMATTITMMTLDLTGQKINLPLLHVGVKADQFFNITMVRRHLKKVYAHVEVYQAKMSSHAPTVISDAKAAQSLIPEAIRQQLRRVPKNRGGIL